jgi:Tfp pilus assembly protein PilO
MDKFLELPLVQRLLIVGILLAIVGGAGHYLIIAPTTDLINRESVKYKNTMNEYSKLKEYDSPEFKDEMDKQRADAIKQRAAYAKMLPREEELPNLISSLKADADASALVLTRFEPGKQADSGPGYRGIGFNVEMIGTYFQIVSFLAGLSEPSKRIINAKDLVIQPAPSDSIQNTAGDVGLLRVLLERERARGLTPNEKYAKSVLLFDDIAKRKLMKVTFTAVAYVYTGDVKAEAEMGLAAAPGAPKPVKPTTKK